MQANLPWLDQTQILEANAEGFADARAGVVEKQEQRMITLSLRRIAIGLPQDQSDILPAEAS